MKKIKGIFVLSVAIAMLAAILAQAQSGQAGSGRYDAQIEQAVTRLLGSKDKWEGITGSTDDGIVTLQGRAKLLIDKLNAGKKVDKVEHVQGVRNHVEVDSSVSDQQLGEQLADRLRYDRVGYGIINVLPVSAMDDDIRIRVARAVYGNSALSKYALDPQKPIRIVVDNGHVTLYGVVDSQMDKQIAVSQARSVPNVFS